MVNFTQTNLRFLSQVRVYRVDCMSLGVLQVGSALCLSRAIDNSADPQLSGLLPRLLLRIAKLLGDQNFMGKPPLFSVVGSIVEAGGASTQQALSGLIPSVQEALQSNDCATRKAASEAFCRTASNIGAPLRTPFKLSCIASLESCRFDKVSIYLVHLSVLCFCFNYFLYELLNLNFVEIVTDMLPFLTGLS